MVTTPQASAGGPGAPAARTLRSRRRRLALVMVLAVLLVTEAIAAGIHVHYRDRALPGTQLAGRDIGGMTHGQIAADLSDRANAPRIAITAAGRRVIVDPAEAGIAVDAGATASRALGQGRGGGPLHTLLNRGRREAGLRWRADPAALQAWLDKQFAAVAAPPAEPAVTFDGATGRFTLTPGQAGARIDAADVLAAIGERATPGPEPPARADATSGSHARPGLPAVAKVANGSIEIEVSAQPVTPAVPDTEARAALARANQLAAGDLTLTADGAPAGRIPRAVIASWLRIEPAGAKLRIGADEAAIAAHVHKHVAPRVIRPAQDDVRITGPRALKIPGTAGITIPSMQAAASTIGSQILRGGDTAALPVRVQTAGARTIGDGEREVDIDLSSQRLSLTVGGQVIRHYAISSGKPSTPTIKGRFAVWHKTTLQDMRGGQGASAYLLKGVKWNSFFEGNYAFHTANWHDDFGTPVSHGCVNMREADAKAAYYFAPIGTKVFVHS